MVRLGGCNQIPRSGRTRCGTDEGTKEFYISLFVSYYFIRLKALLYSEKSNCEIKDFQD